jgi:chromate transporter
MAIHIGHRRAGWRGLLVAGLCFIVPAALITFVLAWAYVRFGSIPRAQGILYGVKPVIIAVVVQAIWNLGRTAFRSTALMALGAVCLLATFMGANELVILFAAGAVFAAHRGWSSRTPSAHIFGAIPAVPFAMGAVGVTATAFSPLKLFLVFLKIGSILFGSGYVLLAFLRADFVERFYWLTEKQLMDAVAVGQLTPGPVFSTATFIGYLIGGPSGSALATLGIFLPAFFFVALSGFLVPRLRRSPVARAFLDGVNVASLALMTAVTWDLGRAALVDIATIGMAGASLVLLFRFKVNSAWLVLGSGVAGGIVNGLR